MPAGRSCRAGDPAGAAGSPGPPLWTGAGILAATGGQGTGDFRVSGISIDSRTLVPGDLFVPLRGGNCDGHDFIGAAFSSGAAGALSARNDGSPAPGPVIRVPDTLAALEALARASRRRSQARIAAITGSVGKTSVKETVAFLLGRQVRTHASAASCNNCLGVPLSLARLPGEAACGVFEAGMNAPGEIAGLVRMIRPHVAAVTSVQPAHMAGFANLEGIADAKAEIFDGMEPGGVAILDADSPWHDRLARKARASGVGRFLSFGMSEEADFRLSLADHDNRNFRCLTPGGEVSFSLAAPGRHLVHNALVCLAIVHALGGDVARAAADLCLVTPLRGRGNRLVVPWGEGSCTVIDDSYNASPASVCMALEVLAQEKGRRLVVLGDMLELGEAAERFHVELAGPVRAAAPAAVFLAGKQMGKLAGLLGDVPVFRASDGPEIVPAVVAGVRAGDTVLVKGSNATGMGAVVRALAGER